MKSLGLVLSLFLLCSCSSSKEESKIEVEDVIGAIKIIPLLSAFADEVVENPNFEGGFSGFGVALPPGPCDRSFLSCNEGLRNLDQTCDFEEGFVHRVLEHRYLKSTGFNDDVCAFDDGGVIVRSFDVEQNRGGYKRLLVSEDHFDYKGSLHGGGLRLLKDSTVLVEVTGVAIKEVIGPDIKKSWSFFSSTPFRLNKFDRSGRTLSHGEVVARDNLRHREMVLRTQSLEYSITCCHPFKGTATLSVDGEPVDLKFEGCGTVKASSELFGRHVFSLEMCQ